MAVQDREASVFINCPFDARFKSVFDAIVFAAAACGMQVRSALEIADSGEPRLQKIMRLLEGSRYSIHDISRVELDADSGLPRFNMPIELGAALGMKHLGRARLRDHRMLVLDADRYRYQTFASDLAGIDISAHGGKPGRAIAAVRDFLATHVTSTLPSPSVIENGYKVFESALPAMAAAAQQEEAELTFKDRLQHISLFIESSAS